MVSVLPAPAPAITSAGCAGAAITSACSGVGLFSPSASAISNGLTVTSTSSYPGRTCPHHPGRCVRRQFENEKRAGQQYLLTDLPPGGVDRARRARRATIAVRVLPSRVLGPEHGLRGTLHDLQPRPHALL